MLKYQQANVNIKNAQMPTSQCQHRNAQHHNAQMLQSQCPRQNAQMPQSQNATAILLYCKHEDPSRSQIKTKAILAIQAL